MPSLINPPSTSPRLCLIGEADPFLALLLRRFAEKCGFQTLQARTGETLLELLDRDQPALVILEPELPGKLRGWEAYWQIQENNQKRAVPVFLCSWLKRDEVQALVGSTPPHLQKPDLHYDDFVDLLTAAGLHIEPEDEKT